MRINRPSFHVLKDRKVKKIEKLSFSPFGFYASKQSLICTVIVLTKKADSCVESILVVHNEIFTKTFGRNIGLSDSGRACEYGGFAFAWAAVIGSCAYSDGVHRLRIRVDYGHTHMGIISQSITPSEVGYIQIPYYHDTPSLYAYHSHDGRIIKNGQITDHKWAAAPENNNNAVYELILDCDRRRLSIVNESSHAEHHMDVSLLQAPFPWRLFIVLGWGSCRVQLL